MRPTTLMPAALIGLGVAGIANAGPVSLAIVSQTVEVDPVNETATFQVDFNRAPNLSLDGAGSQVEAFQYEIDTRSNDFTESMGFDDIASIVRGGEIFEGKGLPIRARDGDGGIDSGGWGPVRTFVPFSLEGASVSFTTSFDALGEDDGIFRYRLISTENGMSSATVYGGNPVNGVVGPFPPGAWTGLSMLGTLGVARLRNRWRKSRTRVI